MKRFSVFVSSHAVARFQERVEQLSEDDCRRVIEEALLKTGIVPELYDPPAEILCRWQELKFRALVEAPPGRGMAPQVQTILWPSYTGQARHINRDGYANMNRWRLPKRLLATLNQECEPGVSFRESVND